MALFWLQLLRLILALVVALPSAITVGIYLDKSFRTKRFLSGRWHGSLETGGERLICLMVLYVENMELAGTVFYEGQSQSRTAIIGLDLLDNLHKKMECEPTRAWYVPATRCTAAFRRTFHRYMLRDGGGPIIDGEPRYYEYQFEVVRRFRAPRIACTVTGYNGSNEPFAYTGDFVRLSK